MKLAATAIVLAAALLAACAVPSEDTREPESASADIINGQDLSIESAPWQVSVSIKDGSAAQYHTCGGAILAPSWVLTAHHCLAGFTNTSVVRVIAGNPSLRNNDPAEQRSYVDRSFPLGLPSIPSPVLHSASSEPDRTRDLELLHLTNPLDLGTPKVRAIPIVDSVAVANGLTAPGVEGFVSGYGASDGSLELRGGPTTILANAAAEAVFHALPRATDPDGWDYRTLVLSPGELPAGGNGARHCFGDSGGPLTVATPNGGRALAGIVSWSPTCDDPNVPGVFARVSEFAPWIKETMAAHDAALARASAASAAVGDATSRDLDARTACKLVEAYVFHQGYEDVRGYEIELTSFACTGAVIARPSATGDIGYASVSGVSFATRGAAPRPFALNACLTHPRDDDKPWWISKLTEGDCF